MAKYRKKPVVVEVFQMTEDRRKSNSEWPVWLHKAWQLDELAKGAVWPSMGRHSDGNDRLMIRTREGTHLVDWGDWIIQGIKGELYPCKPDIFEKTYEVA